MAEKDPMTERGRSLEADYFRRKDEELLERAREQGAIAERRRQLATVLGVGPDDPVVGALGDQGFDAGTAPLLTVVPVLQVAWADGTLPERERAVIERMLERPELRYPARLAANLVSQWMSQPPSADLYRLAVEALRIRVEHADEESRTRLVKQILEDCKAVAAASGGVFGIGTLSTAEANSIRDLASALGIKP